MAKEKYKIHPLTIEDSLKLGGILAGGGLAGRAQDALSQMERNGQGAALGAMASLFMGALANIETRSQMRDFLFEIWKTTEDEQAGEEDLSFDGRLKAKYRKPRDDEDPAWMEREDLLDISTPYYRKLKRFRRLPPSAAVELAKAVYTSEGFEDFLGLLKTEIPAITTEPQTQSNGPTGLHPVK